MLHHDFSISMNIIILSPILFGYITFYLPTPKYGSSFLAFCDISVLRLFWYWSFIFFRGIVQPFLGLASAESFVLLFDFTLDCHICLHITQRISFSSSESSFDLCRLLLFFLYLFISNPALHLYVPTIYVLLKFIPPSKIVIIIGQITISWPGCALLDDPVYFNPIKSLIKKL